jgi:hypothetical protein
MSIQSTNIFSNISKILLWGFLALGLYGALNVSYSTMTGESPCPSVAGVYICYVVLTGYLLMVVAQFLTPYKALVFYLGWIIVFAIALLGTVFEISQGNVCPQSSSGLPLCYVSLLASAIIGILFWMLMKQKHSFK